MSIKWVKRIIWLLLVPVVLGLIWLQLFFAGSLLHYFQKGSDPSSALNIVPNKPVDYQVKVDWAPDDSDTGRKMEPYTRELIEGAYVRAWLQWNLSQIKGEPFGLKTYFTGSALKAVSDSIQQAAAGGYKINQVTTLHRPKLHFYSADGSIISFTDEGARIAQIVTDQGGQVVYSDERDSVFKVVMLLEDGNWRVRYLVRAGEAEPEMLSNITETAGFVKVEGETFRLDGQLFVMAGVNYYPQKTPWDKFWSSYDPQVTTIDLALVKSLRLNTLRIFIPYQQFGGSQPDEKYLAKLDDFLAQTAQQQLKVVITLFDFNSDYNPILWANHDRHLETLLTRYKNNTTILAWDLKNEPDLDFKAAGQVKVELWLRHMAAMARRFDPNHPLTIGWATPASATRLSEIVDFVSFHFYTPASGLPADYSKVKQAAGQKPIAITEFGLPTWNSFFPNGHSEPEQAEYYADVIGFLRGTESPAYLAWTLYDFSYVPGNVAGALPWQNGPQKELGIIKSDGKAKPAAALLAPDASQDVTRVPAWARFLKPFWLALAAIILLAIYLTYRFHLLQRIKRLPGLLLLIFRRVATRFKRRSST
jgi:hypothetical protein